jgi:hypothetical protein
MLEIDYSLVPISDQDLAVIRQDIAKKMRAGVAPVLDRSRGGRVLVVNPDPVQTVHHIPDDLRSSLRRIMVSPIEGSQPLRPERLFAGILDSDEPVAALIIEAQSEFEQFPGFLDYIPELRRRYPDMGVFLSGTLPNVMAKLRQVLETGKATLVLSYPDARGTIDIDDPKELNPAVADSASDTVVFSVPFFSQLRLALDKTDKPVAMNLDTLRKLHPQFGVGEAKDVDIGTGRKEKVVILDIPLRVIRDFQFRQDRGLEFHGIVQNGRTVLSRHFGREKLEFKWIPMKSIEAFLRKMPGAELQQVDIRKAKALRVNCFKGQVSFEMTAVGNQISLADVQMLAIRKKYTPQLKFPEGVKPSPAATNPSIYFDGLALPDARSSKLEPIQQAVRDHYFGRMFMGDAIQRRKRELYTRRLRVAAVGPMAGQTLKLLRRFGLERLIDPESFHYLCDSPQDIPKWEQTAAQYEAHFASLLKSLKQIAGTSQDSRIRLNDINHKLPICTEWVDAESTRFDQVTTQELSGLYHEMTVMAGFISHEFQRHFDIAKEDVGFFEKIKAAHTAGLLAKWLAEFKRGSYGKLLPPGALPDFLFFATPEDKAVSDRKHFFPALACSEFFQNPENRKLFSKVDYEFSVFLEEQLALADHQTRQDGIARPSFEHFYKYFDDRGKAAEAELAKLQEALLGIDAQDSTEYQTLLKSEEEAYYTRYRGLIQERDQVTTQHQKVEDEFQTLFIAIAPSLNLPPDPDPRWLAAGDVDATILDHFLLDAARAERERRKAELGKTFVKCIASLRGWAEGLNHVATAMGAVNQTHTGWQKAALREHLAGHAQGLDARMAERTAAIRKLDARELENHAKRAQAQFSAVDSEIKQMDAQLFRALREQERMRQNLVGWVAKMVARLKTLAERHAGQEPQPLIALLTEQARQMGEFSRSLEQMVAGIADSLKQVESGFMRKQRLGSNRQDLALEAALVAAAQANTAPVIPAPPQELEAAAAVDSPAALEAAFRAKAKALSEGALAIRSGLRAAVAALEEGKTGVKGYVEFLKQRATLERLSAKKRRLAATDRGLAERQALMEGELTDLPRRVVELFMPARKALLEEIFIPESKKRGFYFRQIGAFLQELMSLPQERLQQVYQERAIYRRFSSHQFIRGLQIGYDPNDPRADQLRNVSPAISVFFRTLQYNFSKFHPDQAPALKLEHTEPKDPAQILALARTLKTEDGKQPVTYLVLPCTLAIADVVKVINQKDVIFQGIPQVVMLFIGKFSDDEIQGHAALRDGYFKALKHNIIVNIDGRKLVDNPQTIGLRLLNETLGSTFDTEKVEETPSEDGDVALVVKG